MNKLCNTLILAILQYSSAYQKEESLFIGQILNLGLGYYIPEGKALESFTILLSEPDILNYISIIDYSKALEMSCEEEEILKSEFLIKILKYLDGKTDEYCKKDPSLQQINDLILFNLPFLVQISTERAHELISLYNKTAKKTDLYAKINN